MPVAVPPLALARLDELASKYGTPLQLYDEDLMAANAQALRGAFEAEFPDFVQFFAVKALPNPAVLALLVKQGFGLDCSSSSELYIAEKLGVPPSRVMYTSNYTSKKDLKTAAEQGVIINLDDVSLVAPLAEAAGPGAFPELMSFRLNPGTGRTDSETASNVLGGPDAKFGVPPSQIVEAYRQAKAQGSTRFGIHMMTGSCVLNEEYWLETVTVLLNTMGQLKKELDIDFEFVNIGGGLGIPYRPEEAAVDVGSLVGKLKRTFEASMPAALPKWPRLYMENGRYITGPFGWLVARCDAIKRTEQVYYGLDANMANLMRPGMYGSYHHISVPAADARGAAAAGAEAGAGAATQPSNVVGTLCENNDWFAKGRELPKDVQVGDLFVIHDSGAHSHSMGFQYNGKLRAPEVLLLKGGKEDVLIRDRETIPQLYEHTHIPAHLQ